MLQDVVDDLVEPYRVEQRLLGIDPGDLLVGDVPDLDGVDVVDAERQDVFVSDRVDDGVGVQLLAEGLFGGLELWIAAHASVRCEDRGPGEPEQVVLLERRGDRRVHVAEL